MPEWETRPGEPVPAAAHHRGRRRNAARRGARARHRAPPSDAPAATRRADESGVLGRRLHDRSPAPRRASSSRSRSRCSPACRWRRRSFARGLRRRDRPARRRPGGVVPPPRPAGARLARGGDVAHLVAVARGHRAAGVHRPGRALVAGGSRPRSPPARTRCCRSPRIAVAALLWYCTAMIYACLRFIEEWAQPLTIVNFVLLGLSSGCVLASALAALAGETRVARASRRRRRSSPRSSPGRRACAALRRNAAIRHRSTLQSATGIRVGAPGADVDGHVGRIVQHARVLPPRVARWRCGRIKLASRSCSAFALPRVAAGSRVVGRRAAAARVRRRAARAGARACSPTAGSSSRRRSTRRTCTTRSCPDAAQRRSKAKLQTRCSRRRPLPRAPSKRASMRNEYGDDGGGCWAA